MSKKVQKIFLRGLKIWWSWGRGEQIPKSPIVGGFFIFVQNFRFLRGWVLFSVPFLALFCRLFMQNFRFLRGWEVFFSKKRQFFSEQNFSFWWPGWSFWVRKRTCALLHPPCSPDWKSSRRKLRWWQQNQWKKKGLILNFFTQKEHPAPQEMKFRHKKQKIVLPMVILEIGYPSPQLHQTLKPIRDLFCTTVPIYHVMCIPKL